MPKFSSLKQQTFIISHSFWESRIWIWGQFTECFWLQVLCEVTVKPLNWAAVSEDLTEMEDPF